MSDIPSGFRAPVMLRAGHRCEYCQLSQLGQEPPFTSIMFSHELRGV